MSTISSGTTLTTALVQTGDTTGDLVIKTGSSNTTAMTISGTDQSVTLVGSLTANTNASTITTGTVPTARLATGTANSSTYLRGDQTWAAIASSQWVTSGANISYTTGNVGIGTATANIYSTGNVTNALGVQASGTNQNGLIAVAGTGTGYGGVEFGNATIRRSGIYTLDGSALTFYTNSTNSGTGLTERIRITSAGDVGIGTSSPISNGGYGGLTLNGTSGSLFSLMTNGTETGRIASLNNETSVQCRASTGFITFVQGVSGGTERGRFDTSGNFLFNSGYGSVAVAYGCRAWVNFNGSGGGIRSSGNVTSVAVNGVGRYTVNMTTALPDANYSRVVTASGLSGDGNGVCANTDVVSGNSVTATSSAFFILLTISGQSGYRDSPFVSAAVFR